MALSTSACSQRLGLTLDAISAPNRGRLGRGNPAELDEDGQDDVRELLNAYIRTLGGESPVNQEAAKPLYALLLRRPNDHFVMIAPPMAHKIVNES